MNEVGFNVSAHVNADSASAIQVVYNNSIYLFFVAIFVSIAVFFRKSFNWDSKKPTVVVLPVEPKIVHGSKNDQRTGTKVPTPLVAVTAQKVQDLNPIAPPKKEESVKAPLWQRVFTEKEVALKALAGAVIFGLGVAYLVSKFSNPEIDTSIPVFNSTIQCSVPDILNPMSYSIEDLQPEIPKFIPKLEQFKSTFESAASTVNEIFTNLMASTDVKEAVVNTFLEPTNILEDLGISPVVEEVIAVAPSFVETVTHFTTPVIEVLPPENVLEAVNIFPIDGAATIQPTLLETISNNMMSFGVVAAVGLFWAVRSCMAVKPKSVGNKGNTRPRRILPEPPKPQSQNTDSNKTDGKDKDKTETEDKDLDSKFTPPPPPGPPPSLDLNNKITKTTKTTTTTKTTPPSSDKKEPPAFLDQIKGLGERKGLSDSQLLKKEEQFAAEAKQRQELLNQEEVKDRAAEIEILDLEIKDLEVLKKEKSALITKLKKENMDIPPKQVMMNKSSPEYQTLEEKYKDNEMLIAGVIKDKNEIVVEIFLKDTKMKELIAIDTKENLLKMANKFMEQPDFARDQINDTDENGNKIIDEWNNDDEWSD